MKKLLLIGIIFSFTFSLHAQTPKKAEKLLNQVADIVQSYDNITIEFNYVMKNKAMDLKRKSRGKVILKDEKYRLNLMGMTRLFDGQQLYSIIPEDEEVTISDYNPKKDQGITPSQMMTFYQNGYNYKLGELKDIGGRKIQYVSLTPKNPNSKIKKIILGVDQQTKHIYSLKQIQKNNVSIKIRITSFKANRPLSDKLFQFNKDKYRGYYINRLN